MDPWQYLLIGAIVSMAADAGIAIFAPRPLLKLTRVEQKQVDKAYLAVARELTNDGLTIAADWRAEAVIDAIALGVLQSRK